MNVIEARFYVYEHWRPDTGACFYVGKGHDDRAYKFRRNSYYNHIVKKLARAGLAPEVRIVKAALDESMALALEVERIAYWKAHGATLANITDGGEGVSGLRHTEETRKKIRAKRAAQKIVMSPETREKISLAQKGRPVPMERRIKQSRTMTGRKMPEITRAAIRKANIGSKRSAAAKTNMSRAQRGHATSELARTNMSAAHVGKRHPMEIRRKMSEAQRARWAKLKATGNIPTNLGTGRGWTFVKGAKRAYQVTCGKQRVGSFATQQEAEQAYRAACEKRKYGSPTSTLKTEILDVLKAFGNMDGFKAFQHEMGSVI